MIPRLRPPMTGNPGTDLAREYLRSWLTAFELEGVPTQVCLEQQTDDFFSVQIGFRPNDWTDVDFANLRCAQGPVNPPLGFVSLLAEGCVRPLVTDFKIAGEWRSAMFMP